MPWKLIEVKAFEQDQCVYMQTSCKYVPLSRSPTTFQRGTNTLVSLKNVQMNSVLVLIVNILGDPRTVCQVKTKRNYSQVSEDG